MHGVRSLFQGAILRLVRLKGLSVILFITVEHYAFLVSEDGFDAIFDRIRIRKRNLPYWADPGHQRAVQINLNDVGRGLYWNDLNGHYFEIITRPSGSGG